MKILGLALLISLSVWAQTNATDAAMDGYVQDASGAFVANAKVMARNIDTNQEHETQTSNDGYYRFPLLKSGPYELQVTSAGFTEYRQTGILLSVGKQARIGVSLKVGTAAESITVAADASILELGGQTAQGDVVTEQAVRSLPMTSRNVYNFHLLGPGVKGIPSTGFGTTQFLFGGLNRSTWTVDGIDNTARRNNRQIRLVISTPESVQEMQVLSGSYSAEFGKAAGGIINVQTRSGTNEIHGSGMGLYRPNDLAARPSLAATKPSQSWYTVAGNLSGPLKRDRVWYFINDEFNPLTQPSPVTILPANAVALKLVPADLGNSPFGETFHTPNAKMSYRLNDKNSGFLRYNRFTNDQPGGGGGLTAITRSLTFEDRMNGGAAQLATVISPNMINEFRFGLNRRAEQRNPYVTGNGPANGAYVDVTGVANFGVNPLAGAGSVETSTQFIDNLTWTRGKHTMKAGMDIQTTDYQVVSALTRSFSFGGLAAAAGRPAVTPLDQYLRTLSGDIDPATGRAYTYTQLNQQLGDPTLKQKYTFLNFFVQDEFRVRPNLTLNFGVRYELILIPELDAQAPYELSRRVNNDKNNFAPRVGFSWTPFKDNRTVVRGGYGIYYDTPALNLFLNGAQVNGRRLLTYTIPGTDATAPRFGELLTAGNDRFRVPPNITAYPTNFQILYGHNATLQLEREVVRNLSVNLQYGYWGHRFAPYARDINLSAPVRTLADGRPVYSGTANRPDARFRQINLIESGSTGNYNSMDLTIRKRFSGGLLLSTTWSWSHALSDSNMQGNSVSDPSNRRFDYGNTNGDVRHSWNLQGLYAPRFQAAGLKWVNGFEVSSTLFYNSGFPINALAGSDLNNDLVVNDRLVGRTRNAFQGPALFQMDFRLSRKVKFGDKHTLELIGESENFTNHLNPGCSIEGCTGAVVNRDGAADFGRITSARQARQFQFGMRYSF